jgi:dCTP deaminase
MNPADLAVLGGSPADRGGVLADTQIRAALATGRIVIDPPPARIGSNSVNVTLGRWLAIYTSRVLDPHRDNPVRYIEIPPAGFLLRPGQLYLGVTEQYTEAHGLLPNIDGRSSIGRLGVSVHETAGRGDIGFCGHWTLEIVVARPCSRPWWAALVPWDREGVIVRPGDEIAQLTWHETGICSTPYDRKPGAKYAQRGRDPDPRPQPSRYWKDVART